MRVLVYILELGKVTTLSGQSAAARGPRPWLKLGG